MRIFGAIEPCQDEYSPVSSESRRSDDTQSVIHALAFSATGIRVFGPEAGHASRLVLSPCAQGLLPAPSRAWVDEQNFIHWHLS